MIDKLPTRRSNLFGVALDPTDDELKLEFKAILSRDVHAGRSFFRDPYQALAGCLQDLIERGVCETSGEVEVPSWLTPAPSPSELPRTSAKNNLRFVDAGGCDAFACRVGEFLERQPASRIPVMIAVDHSMAGGALRALAKDFGPADMTVLVADSHFDGLLFSERMELFRCGRGEPPGSPDNGASCPLSVTGTQDAAIRESYNCATWLSHLLDERVVAPERLIVYGVSDYPTKAMRSNPRLSRYVDAYLRFERRGVTFVTREEVRFKGVRGTLEPLLERTAADRLYVSLDADVGSLDAVHAARFMNVVGLNAEELYGLARVLEGQLRKKVLVGLDVCGIETFLLGRTFPNGVKDRTLERLSDFVRILLGQEPRYSVSEGIKDERKDSEGSGIRGRGSVPSASRPLRERHENGDNRPCESHPVQTNNQGWARCRGLTPEP